MPFIRYLNARFIIYTDDSATAGTLNDGTGMVVAEGDPANPEILISNQQHRPAFISSYVEEKTAMRMVVE